jgi:hypothetical protein
MILRRVDSGKDARRYVDSVLGATQVLKRRYFPKTVVDVLGLAESLSRCAFSVRSSLAAMMVTGEPAEDSSCRK